jgi:hypothetical protein
MHNSGASAPRDRGGVFANRHCEEQSDEAIHLSLAQRDGLLWRSAMDCFGAARWIASLRSQ